MSKQPEVKQGQIWKDNDPRKTRFVKIGGVYNAQIEITTTDADGNIIKGSRTSWAAPKRFNGTRNGYSLHKEAA